MHNWKRHLVKNKLALHTAIRAACAVSFGILFCQLFKISYNYWVMFSLIIVLQSNIGASVRKAKERILGTAIGVLIGAFLLIIIAGKSFLLISISTLLILCIVYFFIFSYTLAIGLGSILLILLLGHLATDQVWLFVQQRIIDTCIGALIAIAFSAFLLPTQGRFQLCAVRAQTLLVSANFITQFIAPIYAEKRDEQHCFESLIELEKLLEQGRQFSSDFTYETYYLGLPENSVNAVNAAYSRIHSLLLGLEVIDIHTLKNSISANLIHAIQEFVSIMNQTVSILSNCVANFVALPSLLTLFESIDNIGENIQLASAKKSPEFPQLLILHRFIENFAIELDHISESLKQIRNIAVM